MIRPIPPAPHARPRRAFTLLEVLIVVVIIGILSTLAIIAFRVIGNSSKRQQTQGQFQTLQSLYAEYNAIAPLRFSPSNMPCPQDVTADLVPAYTPDTAATIVPVSADEDTVSNRFGAAVWFTRDLVFNLRPLAAASSALNKLAPGEKMNLPEAYNRGALAAGYGGFPKPYVNNIAVWSAATTTYAPFGKLPESTCDYGRVYLDDSTNGQRVFYECIQALPNGSGLPPNLDKAHWLPAYPSISTPSANPQLIPNNTVPVLLDGWGNPIIFVPGGTLGNAYNITVTTGYLYTGTSTGVAGGNVTPVANPNGRPFFASAGPDGNFSKGDDNLYAFEP